jgi:hypothetical protein
MFPIHPQKKHRAQYIYVKKLREFEDLHCFPKSTLTFKKKLRDKCFMDHFEIVRKKFRSYSDLKKQRHSTSEYLNHV